MMSDGVKGGILSGSAIRQNFEAGFIEIDPFELDQLNPGSYDVRLGTEIVVYQANVSWKNGWEIPSE
jgi:deoxycytidine triphosphate deaminase